MSTSDRWCVAFGRPPHVPDTPPTIIVETARGPVKLCRPCWHRWRTAEPWTETEVEQ